MSEMNVRCQSERMNTTGAATLRTEPASRGRVAEWVYRQRLLRATPGPSAQPLPAAPTGSVDSDELLVTTDMRRDRLVSVLLALLLVLGGVSMVLSHPTAPGGERAPVGEPSPGFTTTF
jgi:hypothetical protein